jgi:response regulator RpfG family c-di-GMP phosphodiesterase
MNPRSVLLIDGNDQDRQHYAQKLRHRCPQLRIFEAASGRVGLGLYKSHSMECVILELVLPDMSGFEVLAKIVPVARYPKVPVIILTCFANHPLLQIPAMNGAYQTLQKAQTDADLLGHTVLKALCTVPHLYNQDATAMSRRLSLWSIDQA